MNDDLSILKLSNIINISVASVIKKDDMYLLIEEKDGWNFPSGKVNFREGPIKAVERETLEESGIEINVTGIISLFYYKTKKNSYNKRTDRITFRINFSADYVSENGAEIVEKDIKQHWLSEQEIKSLIETHKFRNWIAESLAKEVLEHKSYPLDILTIK